MQLPQFYLDFRKDNSWHMDRPHFHENVEFLLPVSNGDKIFIENDVYPLHRGVMFILPDATLHKTLAAKAYERYELHISTQGLNQLSTAQTNFLKQVGKTGHMVHLGKDTSDFIYLLKELEKTKNAAAREFGEDIDQQLLLLSFLIKALSLTSFQSDCIRSLDEAGSCFPVNQVLVFLQEHISEKLTLDDISHHFCVSKSYLNHCFKISTGFSIMKYLRDIRILKACQLLRKGIRVKDVGQAVGFQSSEYFIRTFSSLTGMPPKQYTYHFMGSDRC